MLPQLAPVALAADQVSVTLNDAVTGTGYAGFNGDATNPNPQDLTALGATDWRIWGTGISETPLTGNARKNGGSGISSLGDIQLDPAINVRALGPLSLSVGTGPSSMPFSFSWTDGSSPVTGTAIKAGLQHDAPAAGSVGYGFRLTAPASTTPQRLTFWVSAHHGTGRLTATVGGASQVDTGVIGGQNNGGVYTIDFASDGIEEFLEVTYVLDSVSPSPDDFGLPSTEANVVVYAAALSPTGPATVAAPALYQAIPAAGNQALISGRLSANASSDYEITIKTAATCDEGVLGEGGSTLGSFTTTTDDVGDSYFSELVPNGSDLDTYVTAEVTGPGGVTSSPSTCIVGGPDNDTWPRALEIGPGTVAGSTVTGYIDDAGRARWYKVPIEPGSRIHVNFSSLPADYDIFVFKDIVQAFTRSQLPDDLNRLSAEFAPSAFSPSHVGLLAFGFLTIGLLAVCLQPVGLLAVGVLAVGILALGILAFGVQPIGVLAVGVLAVRVLAIGLLAVGLQPVGLLAVCVLVAETYASAQIRSLITGSAASGTD